MESFEEIKDLILNTEDDVEKFADKGNNAAGTRVRQAMQQLKRLAQEVRIEIQEAKNA